MSVRRRPLKHPGFDCLEDRKLLHAGLDHLSGMLEGIARATTELAAQATRNRPPNAPRILEPARDNQRVAPSDVHMETGPMVDPDPGDTHTASDFEILLAKTKKPVWVSHNVTGIEKVHIHLGDGQFVGAYAGRRELAANTSYILRIRHRDSSGDPTTQWSAWSTRRFVTTANKFKAGQGPVVHGWQVLRASFTVDEVAQGLQLPVSIAFVPQTPTALDAPLFYVAELYGSIRTVAGDGSIGTYATNLLNFNPTGAFPGSGETGLASLVVEPTTGDLFATLLYSDANGLHHPKVIRLHSDDGGRTAATQTTILDVANEVQGASHQISSISIGPDGKLYVHMGDGMEPSSARNLGQFRGKILRMNLDGTAPADNPFYNAGDGINATDYIYAYGFRNPFGGAWRARDGGRYSVENGPSTDRLAKVVRGRDYGWNDTNNSMKKFAAYNWSPAVAPVNIVFVQPQTFGGSGFPAGNQDHAFVTESGPTFASGPQSRGKRIVEFSFDAQGRRTSGPVPWLKYAGTGRATAAALAAGPDGLYFSELYGDRSSNPAAPQARILRVRYVPPQRAGANSATGHHH
jgi:glucose/arabinose dehydrogenase